MCWMWNSIPWLLTLQLKPRSHLPRSFGRKKSGLYWSSIFKQHDGLCPSSPYCCNMLGCFDIVAWGLIHGSFRPAKPWDVATRPTTSPRNLFCPSCCYLADTCSHSSAPACFCCVKFLVVLHVFTNILTQSPSANT